jgi:hypothetical protein
MDSSSDTKTSTDPQSAPEQPKLPRLTEIPITDDNVALNVMVGFLDTAQKRGAYSMDESAKIWECVQRFIQQQPQPSEKSDS